MSTHTGAHIQSYQEDSPSEYKNHAIKHQRQMQS
jgi:hypothetical protein